MDGETMEAGKVGKPLKTVALRLKNVVALEQLRFVIGY